MSKSVTREEYLEAYMELGDLNTVYEIVRVDQARELAEHGDWNLYALAERAERVRKGLPSLDDYSKKNQAWRIAERKRLKAKFSLSFPLPKPEEK